MAPSRWSCPRKFNRAGSVFCHTLKRNPRQNCARLLRVIGKPKTLHSIERFRKAWEALTYNPQQALHRLAFELGYSDQSHLTREFKRFAGMTPGAYVVFVQDAERQN